MAPKLFMIEHFFHLLKNVKGMADLVIFPDVLGLKMDLLGL